MGGQVGSTPACYGRSLGSNPNISQKYKMGKHKQRSGQHILARQKNIRKKTFKEATNALKLLEGCGFKYNTRKSLEHWITVKKCRKSGTC
jgi:Ni,Fe-hydrogenase I large subunit